MAVIMMPCACVHVIILKSKVVHPSIYKDPEEERIYHNVENPSPEKRTILNKLSRNYFLF